MFVCAVQEFGGEEALVECDGQGVEVIRTDRCMRTKVLYVTYLTHLITVGSHLVQRGVRQAGCRCRL